MKLVEINKESQWVDQPFVDDESHWINPIFIEKEKKEKEKKEKEKKEKEKKEKEKKEKEKKEKKEKEKEKKERFRQETESMLLEDDCNWSRIDSFPGYYVSDDGRVLGKKRTILKQYNSYYGTPCVRLYQAGRSKTRAVCVLVAEAFLTRSAYGRRIIHLNGCSHDNRAQNLLVAGVPYNRNNSSAGEKIGVSILVAVAAAIGLFIL